MHRCRGRPQVDSVERGAALSKTLRRAGLLAAAVVAALLLACTAAEEATTPAAGDPTDSPSGATIAAPDQATTQTPDSGYNSTENMFLLYSRRNHNPVESHEAIELAIANNDKSMVPVLIEALRFFINTALELEINKAIATLTGQEAKSPSNAWHEWMEWLGRNADDYHPPEGYVDWKIELMNLIDPRFEEFLAPAAQGSRINVFEIAWGGVRPDGIPDLQSAPAVPADEQDYLLPTDRVFGVSINGEHRAYPLRIVNAHEMANDVLGGEPIALAY